MYIHRIFLILKIYIFIIDNLKIPRVMKKKSFIILTINMPFKAFGIILIVFFPLLCVFVCVLGGVFKIF